MTNKIKKTIETIKGNQLFHIGHITDINNDPYITQEDLLELTDEVERLKTVLTKVDACGAIYVCDSCTDRIKQALADSTDGIELKKWRPSSFGETVPESQAEEPSQIELCACAIRRSHQAICPRCNKPYNENGSTPTERTA